MKDKLIGLAIGVVATVAFFLLAGFKSEQARMTENNRYVMYSTTGYDNLGHPSITTTYLVDSANGGVWKTTDGGSFKQVFSVTSR